jgi:hypothetical protein
VFSRSQKAEVGESLQSTAPFFVPEGHREPTLGHASFAECLPGAYSAPARIRESCAVVEAPCELPELEGASLSSGALERWFAVRVPDRLPKWCEAGRAGAFLSGRSVVKVYA